MTFLSPLLLLLAAQTTRASPQWYEQNWGFDSRNPASSCGKGNEKLTTNTCGPAAWSNAGYPTCKQTSKSQQSPIDISHAVFDDKLTTPLFTTLNGGCLTWTQFNSLDDISIDLTQPDALCTNLQMQYEGVTWVMKELRFKSPSEHTIAGGHYDSEAQMIHVNAANNHVAIVSVLMNVHDQPTRTNNSFLDTIWKSGPNSLPPSQTTVKPGMIADDSSPYTFLPYTFLPGSRNHFQYVGSLTEPPCSEDVDWFVFKDVVSISSDDLGMIRSVRSSAQPTYLSATGDNNRPLQSGYSSVQPFLHVRYTDGSTQYNPNPASTGASLAALFSTTNMAVAALVLAVLALILTCWSNYLLFNARGGGKRRDGPAARGHSFSEDLPPSPRKQDGRLIGSHNKTASNTSRASAPAAPAPAPVLEKRAAKKKRKAQPQLHGGPGDADAFTTTTTTITNPMYSNVIVSDPLDEVL